MKKEDNEPVAKSQRRKTGVAKEHLKEWAREYYRGMENLLMPSFSPDFRILDEEGIRQDTRNSIRHGFFSSMCAPIGLNADEFKRLIEIVCSESRGNILTGAIVDGNSLEEDLHLLAHAEKAGCSHVFLSLRMGAEQKDEAELYEAYTRRIDFTPLAVVLYASVSHDLRHLGPSGVPISVFDRLADLPNVVAVKLTQPMNLSTAFQVCERLSDRLLIGPVNLDFVPMLAKHYRVQWSGQWNVEAVQSPEKPYAVEFMNLLNKAHFAEAMDIYSQLQPLLRDFYDLQAPLILKGGHPWVHMKYYQWCVGGNGGLIRDLQEPIEQVPVLDAEGRQRIKESFRRAGITATSAPDEEFVVGKANYLRGVRVDDLNETPVYT